MKQRRGFTLVELMIVVVILGILAAIAIPLYMKFVNMAKSGEARLYLGKIASLTERYYDSRANQALSLVVATGVSTTDAAQFPQNAAGGCVTVDAPEAVPGAIASVANKKFLPSEIDWSGTDAAPKVWRDLPFAITQAIAYQYCYDGQGVGSASTFAVGAFGDVDGDGVYSSFQRQGAVIAGAPTLGNVVETNATE